MKITFVLMVLSILVSILACSSTNENQKEDKILTEEEAVTKIAYTVKREYDSFKKLTTYKCGPVYGFNENNQVNEDIEVFFRAWIDNSDSFFQLYVSEKYLGDSKRYSEAYNSRGEKMEFTSIDTDYDCKSYGCYVTESYGIGFSKDQILELSKSTQLIKIYGKNGQNILQINSRYTKGCLKGMGIDFENVSKQSSM